MERRPVIDQLRSVVPFDRLAFGILTVLDREAKWVALQAGEQLFAFGEKGDCMYVVVEGRIEIIIPGQGGESIVVAELGADSVIGEIQILMGGERTATARAAAATQLISLPRSAFDRLALTEPAALTEFNALILRRLRRNQMATILTQYFGALPLAQMQEIESIGEWRQLEQGEILFRQGDRIEHVCVVVSGSLGIRVRESADRDTLVGTIRRGGLAGETALLADEPAAATVYAARETELMQFSLGRFAPLLEKYPKFLLHLARSGVARSRDERSSRSKESTATIICLLPSGPAPLADFAQRLVRELSLHASVLHLNSANIDGLLEISGVSQAPKISPQSARFSAWLGAQEAKHRFILLEADAEPSNWTRRCLVQGDQVIAVGVAGESPQLQAIEAELYAGDRMRGIPKRLVLIHPEEATRPVGTAAWIEPRDLVMHHHVRLGHREDFQRLARFLAGAAVGVALGGGGARGFAHVGAFRALQEAGIPIDIIGGTSMGAVVGAEFAHGIPPGQMVEVNRGLFSNFGLLLDLTLPLLSFTTGRAYARTLKDVFGDVAIEDLWIPFFCVSSNISHAVMALHRTGLLRRKLRASSGVQGLFPPVVMNGELHVDGALFSNLPADAMRSVATGKVIAIDVTPPVDLEETPDYGDTISGWRLLWNRIFGRGGRSPSVDLGTVMQRSAEAASMARQKRVIESMTDFYVLMPVQKFNLMNFGAIDRLVEIGYATTQEAIASWQKDGRIKEILPEQGSGTSD